MAKSPKFSIHVNRELGNKKFYTERDYRKAMDERGLSHYDPSSVKKTERKPYTRSKWAEAMYADIIHRKGRAPGDGFINELKKRGYTQASFEQARKLANQMGGR